MRTIKIISGGQAGVDRAAWDAAIELGIDWGGWVPKGRLAEDGPIPARYDRCRELDVASFAKRTHANVMEGHATLIVSNSGRLTGGTLLTYEYAFHHRIVEVATGHPVNLLRDWLEALPVRGEVLRLNVAGPRASKWPEGYESTKRLLLDVLR